LASPATAPQASSKTRRSAWLYKLVSIAVGGCMIERTQATPGVKAMPQ
jgi:hypothetical protein